MPTGICDGQAENVTLMLFMLAPYLTPFSAEWLILTLNWMLLVYCQDFIRSSLVRFIDEVK